MLILYSQIQSYLYDNEEAARSLLTFQSIRLAIDNFPIGAGFASYGTDMAAVYYSKLYTQLGFNYVWGLTQNNTTSHQIHFTLLY